MNSCPQHVAIIGVGSPFGADRLGWQAIDYLQQSTLQHTFSDLRFTFLQSDRPGAQLLELLRESDSAIIIDAMQSGQPPGTLRCFTPAQLATEKNLLSSHGFGVAEALALGYTLELGLSKPVMPQHLVVIGIEMGEGVLLDTQALLAIVMQSMTEW